MRSLSARVILAALGCVAATSVSMLADVTRGSSVKTIRLTGTVEAVRFSAIRVPQLRGAGGERIVITRLIAKGSQVKKGDLIVEFDPQSQLRAIEDQRAELLDLEEQVTQKRGEQLAERAKDETALRAAENALFLARLEVRKNELLPRIVGEKNQLAFELAQATLLQLQKTAALKRKAAELSLRVLEVRRDRSLVMFRQAERNLDRMSVRSPIDGLVVYRNFWRNGRMGDPMEGLELGPGTVVADVIGTDAMRVRVKANQADVNLLRIGQTATIRLDAYPGRTYQARLDQLAPSAVTSTYSSRVRTFATTFRFTHLDDLVMPDLSAAVDVEVELGQPGVP
jgi:HlyD family secretion protein